MAKYDRPDGAERLKQNIAGKAFYPIYALWGDEGLLMERWATKLAEAFLGCKADDSNFSRYDGTTLKFEVLEDDYRNVSFFSQNKVIWVRDPDFLGDGTLAERFLALAADPVPGVLILLFVGKGYLERLEADQQRKLTGILEKFDKVGMAAQFARRTPAELTKWLRKQAETRKCSLSPELADLLIRRVGSDMAALEGELEKLTAVAKGEITRQMVEELTNRNLEVNVFDLTDAAAAGDLNRVLTVLRDCRLAREEPIKLLTMLENTVCELAFVKAAQEAGEHEQSGIAAAMGMKKNREFLIRRYQTSVRGTALSFWKRAVRALFEADRRMKSSPQDGWSLLETAVLEWLAPSMEGK